VGGYGYLFLGTWKPPVDIEQLDLALARARDLPGLIIDVRANGGGIDATALAFASRFVTRTFPASYTQIRSGPGFDDLNEPVARSVGARGAVAVRASRRDHLGPRGAERDGELRRDHAHAAARHRHR
jgi:hypothetical protein